MNDRIAGGLWGAAVGDALGVPVEFLPREKLKQNPVTGMRSGGTHKQPAGTWSDDTSLMLCTIDSLLEGFDLRDLGNKFLQWFSGNLWRPHGEVFDIGQATSMAMGKLANGIPPLEAGQNGEWSNGNGSIMRILPIAMYGATRPTEELLQLVHMASSPTHRHPRSQMGCGFYCMMATRLLEGETPQNAYPYAIAEGARIYRREERFSRELAHFERFLNGDLHRLKEQEIESGGYVIHTLEASVWCLLNSASYSEAVLKAVNLGSDTDTTGIATGGLAGVHYGQEAIPKEWIEVLARRDDLEKLFGQFAKRLNSSPS